MKTLVGFLTVCLFLLTPAARAADTAADPVKSVMDHYLKIHSQLAKDSNKGVAEHATAISEIVKNDSSRTLPPEMGAQADALAKAKDLAAARQAFKPLSASLVKYFDKNKDPNYHHAYCSMANASWLQKGKAVQNPYMGKEMLDCGEFKD